MKKIYIMAAFSLLILSGCNGTEKAEEVSAEETAAQMEGREEARKFLNRPWKDTLELQRQLLESSEKRSKYIMKGEKENAEAYDSAFISTLRTVRPELAEEVIKAKQNKR